ncbi:MAG: type III pantothenate kinase [Gemmatimonadales bacterium]
MLLAVDVGNSETTVGLFRGDVLEASWRVTTGVERTPDEWGALLTSYFSQSGRSTHEVRAAIIASVVPAVTGELAAAIHQACGVTAAEVTPQSPLPVTLDVEEPRTVGADRIVNTLAAHALYARDTIVVDFGTATTFDCVTADGRFIGGVIAPGIRTAADTLIRNTAKLPATALTAPSRALGRRTEDCIRSGVVFGAADAAGGIVRRLIAEWPGGGTPHVVATGGLAVTIALLVPEIEVVEPSLTLVGLKLAARHLKLTP